jgi:hypothetical protein
MNLRTELEHLAPSVEPSPWPGHEHVRGYGVFGLPLSSGHTLALRVFPINDFAPYVTVWHQTRDGTWSIYYQAPRPDVACPRYYGPAVRHVVPAEIDLEWRSGSELRIRVDRAQLEWTVWMREPPLLRVLNAVSRRLPLWTWRSGPLLRARERMAERLGMGAVRLAGRMPSGHFGVLMPQRMYFVDRAEVTMAGVDLGTPVRVQDNPMIGDVPLPARGIFAIGQAHWEIRDEVEYRRTRHELTGAAPANGQWLGA